VLGVIGAQEATAGAVSLRSRRQGDLGVISSTALIAAAATANSARAAALALEAP
jgi:threonyl-tRNA synthetase